MQIYTALTTLLLAATALACDQGPYKEGTGCGGTCLNAHRCSMNGQNVVCQQYTLFLIPYRLLTLIHYFHVSYVIYPELPIPPT